MYDVECPACNGRGYVTDDDVDVDYSRRLKCLHCLGAGFVVSDADDLEHDPADLIA